MSYNENYSINNLFKAIRSNKNVRMWLCKDVIHATIETKDDYTSTVIIGEDNICKHIDNIVDNLYATAELEQELSAKLEEVVELRRKINIIKTGDVK